MAVDDVFEVTTELPIQCYSRTTLLENSERFGKQPGARSIARNQLGNDTRIRFDMDFITIRRTGHEPLEVVCRFCSRNVNDGHTTMIPRLPPSL